MKSSPTHLPSLLGSLLFVTGAALLLGASSLLAILVMGGLLTGRQIEVRETILVVVTAFEGLLLLGAAYVSIQKFRQKPFADVESSFNISSWQIVACLIAAGAAIWIGQQILDKAPVSWLLLPLLTLPAVLLPILVLLGLGVRGIPLGPRWRAWNVLGISMTLVPFTIFFLEAVAGLVIFILVALFIGSQPDLMAQMEKLSQQIYMLQTDPEALMQLMAPLMLRPGVIIVGLIFFAVLVPLMEELFKPLGVWLFANQIGSPAQGFALGALSGSAYALIETLGVSPQSADWSNLLLTRLGTDILHVTTSALMGAGIIYAIREHHYLRLLGIYLLSVSLHGLWNGLAILFTFSNLSDMAGKASLLNDRATTIAIVMAGTAIFLLILLLASNRRIRAAQPKPVPEELAP